MNNLTGVVDIALEVTVKMEDDYEDDADFAFRNGEYDNEVDEYGN